jgi:DNA-directed RNA polymerase specialized sigma24 family protein
MLEPDANQEDMYLLYNAPARLLGKYQYFIEFIVESYVKSGSIPKEEKEDVIQNINAKLWEEGISKMQQKYDRRALVKTYLGVILKGYCNNEYRRLNTQKAQTLAQKSEPLRSWHKTSENMNFSLHIEQEKKRLEKLLFLFGKSASKLRLCLKLYYYIPISSEDILAYHPEAPAALLDGALSELRQNFVQKELKELFEVIIAIVNDKEKKDIAPDSLRRWTKDKITELIELINGDPPLRFYDEEALGALLHYYFENIVSEA